jgi:hypothetical protein
MDSIRVARVYTVVLYWSTGVLDSQPYMDLTQVCIQVLLVDRYEYIGVEIQSENTVEVHGVIKAAY